MKSKMRSPKGKFATAITAAAVASTALLAGCNTTGCTDNRSSIPLAGFYSASDEAAVTLDSLEIGGVGAPNDSLLLHAGEKAKEIYLPLRSTATSASFYIIYRQKALERWNLADTVTMDYVSTPYFASEECGAMYRYRITALTHTSNLLDSVAVTAVDSLITNRNIETLRFFFLTSDTNDPE